LSRGRSSLVVAGLVIGLLVVFIGRTARPRGNVANAAPPAGTASTELPVPKVSATVPRDVDIPHPLLEDLSWQTFLALNWPAVEGKRGLPDNDKKLGDKAAAVVWESWKSAHELFQEGGKPPTEWDSFEAISPCKDVNRADAGKVKQLVSTSKFGPVLE